MNTRITNFRHQLLPASQAATVTVNSATSLKTLYRTALSKPEGAILPEANFVFWQPSADCLYSFDGSNWFFAAANSEHFISSQEFRLMNVKPSSNETDATADIRIQPYKEL